MSSFSFPPRYKNSSQLPIRLSYESLNKAFHLCNVLDDDTAGNPSGTHGCQNLVKIIRQGYVWPFIHNAVYRNRKPSSVLPICHIIQCLKTDYCKSCRPDNSCWCLHPEYSKTVLLFSPQYCISPVRPYRSGWRFVSD